MLKYFLVLGIMLIASVGMYWFFNPMLVFPTNAVHEPEQAQKDDVKLAQVVKTSNQVETVPEPGMKMYRNDEFGFEFQYPEGWTVSEERDTNPYNKFKVAVTPLVLQYFQPFYVLVAKKEHGDRLINNSLALGRDIKDISVGGRSAIRYEYEGEVHYTAIIISISEEHSFIIGNERNENVSEFNEILSTFKFIQ